MRLLPFSGGCYRKCYQTPSETHSSDGELTGFGPLPLFVLLVTLSPCQEAPHGPGPSTRRCWPRRTSGRRQNRDLRIHGAEPSPPSLQGASDCGRWARTRCAKSLRSGRPGAVSKLLCHSLDGSAGAGCRRGSNADTSLPNNGPFVGRLGKGMLRESPWQYSSLDLVFRSGPACLRV